MFDAWNNALRSGDVNNVVSLYAADATLLPTLSPVVRRDHEGIADYFKFFLQLSPVARIEDEDIRLFGDVAVNSGIYVFTVTHNDIVKEIPVRFTFVYRKSAGKCLIVEHHSSRLPD